MDFYTYFRSSSAYRVRIALNLKGLKANLRPIHLLNNGGEQHAKTYKGLNPNQLVPTLVDGDALITQSLAICEYLDETYPGPRLLPAEPVGRARVRSLAMTIACDIHPINNLRVLQYLTDTLGISEGAKTAWYRHWIEAGFGALETMLIESCETGRFCHGEAPTLADLCLVPQVYNARRFNIDLTPYPTIEAIDEACQALPAFADAAPERQPDAG